MKKLALLLFACAIFFVSGKAHAQSIENCKSGACYGFGAPVGSAINGYIYQDVSQTPPALYCPKNGAWVACGGGSSSGVSSIDTQTGAFTFGGIGVSHTGTAYTFSGGSSSCPVINATNLCLTSAPYNASIAGATTTTTSGTFGVGTSGAVGSCSTFSAGNGILITGAGTAGANYIGSVVSCSGTALTVTPATSTSVASGVVVQHDETAAFLAAIAALNATSGGGNIRLPCGLFLVNGPLLDTGGANAVLPMPVQANYIGVTTSIGIYGCSKNNVGSTTSSTVIQTSHTGGGNFFGGFDAATGGSFPPFTSVWLDIEGVELIGPSNPDFAMIGAKFILNLTVKDVLIHSPGSSPSNAGGIGIVFPEIANQERLFGDNIAIDGFYTGFIPGEHTHIAWILVANMVNCMVADPGANVGAPAGYQGNTVSIDYMWCGPGTNGIVAGANKIALSIQAIDFESLTGNGFLDASNLLYGIANYNVPVPASGFSYCNPKAIGSTNLKLNALWCSSGTFNPTLNLVENWQSQDGSGTTLANTGTDSTNSSTTTSVTWATATGFTGNVATYNGTSSFSQAASATNTAFTGSAPFSACAWVNPSTYAFNAGWLLSNMFAGQVTGGWGLGVFGSTGGTAGRIMFAMSTASGGRLFIQTAATAIGTSAGVLSLACATYDGSGTAAGAALYGNGALVASTVVFNSLAGGSTASTLTMGIGRANAADAQYFPGAIGRVRIYTRQLSSTDVAAMYAAGPNTF